MLSRDRLIFWALPCALLTPAAALCTTTAAHATSMPPRTALVAAKHHSEADLKLRGQADKYDHVTATVKVSPVRRGAPVLLQERKSGSWHTLKRGTQNKHGNERFGISTHHVGASKYRAIARGKGGRSDAKSATDKLHVKPLHQPLVVAHRGASHARPENTLPAFQKAIDDKTDRIELDVQQTSDGAVVVFHDPHLGRTTNAGSMGWASDQVKDHTLAELKSLDAGSWFDDAYAGTKIPTLQQALDLIKPKDPRLMVELKAGPGDSRAGRAAVVRMLHDGGWIKNREVTIDSFNTRYLHGIRQLHTAGADNVKLAPVFAASDVPGNPSNYNWADALCIPMLEATKSYNAKAHHDGLNISSYVADTRAQMRYVLRSKADTLVTDRPDKAVAFLR